MSGRVLITGGAGFIGSNLADRLAGEGHDVLVFDALTRPGVERNLAWLQRRHPARVASLRADVRDRDAVASAVADAGVVFHLAAQVAVTTSLVDPAADFDTNLRGTLNILEALRRRGDGTPLVFASTNKVYGDLSDIPLDVVDEAYLPADPTLRAAGIGEDRPLDFHTPYGCSKGAADQYVLDYFRSFGVPTCALRMSCIYGPRQMGTEDQGWVAHFLIQALQGRAISIYGDGRQVRDILNAADAVDAYLAAWRNIDSVAGRAFNLGGGPENAVSLRRLVAHIETVLGRPVDTNLSAWRAGDQRYFVADTSAARLALGLEKPLGWRDGVAGLADWLKAAAGTKVQGVAPVTADSAAPGCFPRRILMTTDAVGGVWTYSLDLARGLAGRGVATTLAVMGPAPSAMALEEAASIPELKLAETDLPLDWTAGSAAEITRSGAAIARLASHAGADLVQLNAPALAAGTRFPVPAVGVCHSCVGTWWAEVRGGEMPADFRWRSLATRQGLAACDALVAPTAAFAALLGRTYDIAPPLRVHNGRAAWPAGGSSRRRLVLAAGRLWDAGKDFATLDAAAALIDAACLVAGPVEGPDSSRFTPAHATPLGNLAPAEVRTRMAESLIFVSPARYEPFGLAVLEAAQAGCALVLADIATFRELWDGAAVFVPPGDPEAFAAALQAQLDRPARCEELAAAARTRAARYSVEALTSGMLDVYAGLLGRPEQRTGAEAAA